MKLLQFSSFWVALLITMGSINASEIDILQQKVILNGTNTYKCVGTTSKKQKGNSIQAMNFVVMDSIANSLTYMNDKQSPLIWDAAHNYMVTIKRGSHEVSEPDYNSTNSKNNLFIRTSTDLGDNWAPSKLVYDKDFWKFGESRFPSIALTFENNKPFFYMTFALIVELQSAWKGWGNGVYGDLGGADGAAWMSSEKFTSNKKNYNWGQFYYATGGAGAYSMSDSRLFGWQQDGKINIFATGMVTPNPVGDLTDNGNFAFRKIVDLDDATSKYVIPPAWKSTNFGKVDTVVSRPNEMINLKKDASGKVYFGVFGNFTGPKTDSLRNECGVSTSTDNGDTWTDFEIFPFQVIRDFAATLNLDPNGVSLGFDSKDLVVFDNGDYSYVAVLTEVGKSFPETKRFLLELYKENGTFGVRKITADIPQTTVPFTDASDAQAGNAKDYEVQASRSADGKYLLAKWVQLDGIEFPDSTHFTFTGSDIFCSLRDRGANQWTKPSNITNSDGTKSGIFKGVWIPDVLPNDKKKITIFNCQTVGDFSIANQRKYLSRQYVMVGHFDADAFSDVNDETILENKLSIYPNPSNDKSTISFNLNESAILNLTITDITGSVVLTQNGVSGQSGINAIYIDTKKLENGVYFVNLNSAKIKLTQKLNIIK